MNMKNINLSTIAEAISKHGVEILTQTRTGYLFECFKKHQFRFELGLVPISDKEVVLSFGSLVHECLERWHEPIEPIEPDEMGGMIDRGKQQSIFALINATYADRLVDEYQKELWHYATAMMRAYMAKYPPDAEPFKVIYVERGACGPIFNPKTGAAARAVAFGLKADGLVQMKDGSYYLLEHKTASQINNGYLDKLWNDFQIIVYSLYLEEQEGIKISGVLYNVLTKPRLKQTKGETDEEYQARYEEACRNAKSGKSSAKQKIAESDADFQERLARWYTEDNTRLHREEILIDKQQYDEVRNELWQIAQLYLHLRRQGSWPRNRKACFNWNRKCGYHEVCSAKPHEVEAMAELFLKKEKPHRELLSVLGVTDETETEPVATNTEGQTDTENTQPTDTTPEINDAAEVAFLNEQAKNGNVDLWGDF